MALLRKFGKLAPKGNYKTLQLSNYLHSHAPVVPASQDWDYDFKAWTMLKNDLVGDCTAAAIGHMVMLWTAFTGTMVRPTADQAIEVYSAVTGYDPTQTQPDGSNPTDNGAAITDILDYWRRVGIAGHKIDGWAAVDFNNLQQVKRAIYIFGGVDIGFQVPASAMIQNEQGLPWTVVPNDGGIVGSHSIPMFDYNATDTDGATWGMIQKMTWNFWLRYVDECYVPLSLDWLYKSGVAPSHLNLAQLRADLQALPND